jgi:hypothetical protein
MASSPIKPHGGSATGLAPKFLIFQSFNLTIFQFPPRTATSENVLDNFYWYTLYYL